MFRNNYLVPAFGSFILHAILAMYLLGSLDFNNKNMEIKFEIYLNKGEIEEI